MPGTARHDENTLIGMPAAAGVATGRARIVLDPATARVIVISPAEEAGVKNPRLNARPPARGSCSSGKGRWRP